MFGLLTRFYDIAFKKEIFFSVQQQSDDGKPRPFS